MRKELLIVTSLAVVMLGLASCGSKSAAAAESIEAVQSADKIKFSSVKIEHQSETTAEETSTEVATEKIDGSEMESSEVTWYMDSDGLKNDTLGIVVRKNGNEGRLLSMSADLLLKDERAGFYCNYYDGNIDTYISEHPIFEETYPYNLLELNDKQKAMINNVEYAYAIGDSGSALVVFVGNGIAVSTVLFYDEGETYEDRLNKLWSEEYLIEPCDDFKMDCLAYMTDDGLYCPALGMKFTSTYIASFSANCNLKDSSYYAGGWPVSISFREWVPGITTEDKNAQDAVEKSIRYYNETNKDFISEGLFPSAGEMETRNFGKYTYYGVDNNKMAEFYADGSGWYIDYSYGDETYKDYIDCIESLE